MSFLNNPMAWHHPPVMVFKSRLWYYILGEGPILTPSVPAECSYHWSHKSAMSALWQGHKSVSKEPLQLPQLTLYEVVTLLALLLLGELGSLGLGFKCCIVQRKKIPLGKARSSDLLAITFWTFQSFLPTDLLCSLVKEARSLLAWLASDRSEQLSGKAPVCALKKKFIKYVFV